MSWDCPHYDKNICKLNGIECKPGKGNCVLRDKYEIISPKKIKEENPHKLSDRKNNSKKI